MLPEFRDQTKNYDDFKTAVFKLYPTADELKKWTREDLFNLVIRTMQQGINTLEEWSNFYRDYYAISSYLITKNRFSADEQGRKIFDVLSPTVRDRVLNRLQIKEPDHAADEAYTLAALNDAITWVLTGGGSLQAPAAASVPSSSSTASQPIKSEPSDGAALKSEDIRALIDAFSKMRQQPPDHQRWLLLQPRRVPRLLRSE